MNESTGMGLCSLQHNQQNDVPGLCSTCDKMCKMWPQRLLEIHPVNAHVVSHGSFFFQENVIFSLILNLHETQLAKWTTFQWLGFFY